jgi:hypothetical protein
MQRLVLAVFGLAALPGLVCAQAPAQAAPAPISNEDLNLRAYIELLRTDVRKSKARVMGQVMQLDAEQAAKFWPIYREFETQLAKIGDGVMALIKDYTANYDKMTPETADNLAVRLLEIEGQRVALKKTDYGRIKTALDAITAMRFLQVENQLDRLTDLQIASQLPVVN